MTSRRDFIKLAGLSAGSLLFLSPNPVNAKTYLTIDQAKELLWPGQAMIPITVELTEAQMDAIKSASSIRVRNASMKVWKVEGGGWFILDKVIGKHEFIDIAVAYYEDGSVKGYEVLTYIESYGYEEIAHPKWKAQFHKSNYTEFLKLNKQIKNMSGATLSCRHVTDGINRLNHTWHLVLQYL